MGEFYVYVYRIDGIARYVGKGKGKRFQSHEKAAGRAALALLIGGDYLAGVTRWHKALARAYELGTDVRVTVYRDLDELEAFTEEKALVEQHGRIGIEEGGTLWNWWSGGTGPTSSDMVASMSRPEVRQNVSKGIRKYYAETPGAHEKLTAALTKAWRDPVSRAARVAVMRSEDSIRARSVASVVRHADPKMKAEHSASLKAMWARPGHREKVAATQRIVQNSAIVKDKNAAGVRRAMADEKVKAKCKAAVIASGRNVWPDTPEKLRLSKARRAFTLSGEVKGTLVHAELCAARRAYHSTPQGKKAYAPSREQRK